MKKAILLSCFMAVPAFGALSWSENFNSYPGGTTNWGAGAVANGWTMPSNDVKMDGYIPSGGSGSSPRLSGADQSAITNFSGTTQSYGPKPGENVVLTYRAAFSRSGSETEYLNGHDFIALGATQADIDAIPHDKDAVLGAPVNAIALGHQGGIAGVGGNQALRFFDGDNWINLGNYTTSLPFANQMRYNTGLVTVTIKSNGDVTIDAPSSSGTDMVTIAPNFQFSFLGIDHVNASPVSSAPATYDDITLTAPGVPEPASLTLIGLAGLALLRRRR